MANLDRTSLAIAKDGWSSLFDVFTRPEVLEILAEVETSLNTASSGNIKSSLGETYAARNLADLNPNLLTCWKKPVLVELLHAIVGKDVGLVRILYFDKHPNRTCSLPWHKDMTIAVKDNSFPSQLFTKPARKSGVDHVEASVEQLEQMLTLRIHLDDVTEDNGPLEVIAGSHRNGKAPVEEGEATTVLAEDGDVLAIATLDFACEW